MQKQNNRRLIIQPAWIILAVIMVGMGATFGMRVSFGAYISTWESDFAASRTMVTSVATVNFIVYALGQPLAGKLEDRFGRGIVPIVSVFLIGISLLLTSMATQMWQVFILYGVLFSLGFAGCSNVVFSAILTNWFDEKRGLALGLSMAGMASGQLILVPANQFIMEKMGWRPTLALLTIIVTIVVGLLFLFLLRSRPEEKGLKPYGYKEPESKDKTDDAGTANAESSAPILGLFKHKIFWLLTLTFFVCGFTDVGLIQTHLFPLAGGKGISDSFVAIAFSLMAISNIAGTIITGHLSDRVSRKWQLAAIYTIRAATYVFLILIQRSWLLFPFAITFGLVDMSSGAPTISLLPILLGKYSVGVVLGFISLGHHLGGAVGSWLPGLLYDLTDSYMPSMVLSIALLIVAALLALRIREPKRNKDSTGLKA